ncbi:hypothetical protein GE061_017698 [Apolygus lucorum]|uniref:SH3 domain-containing protein n=1 Tax=Apolygus lucorum TaxID=248454 RepID=A0A8S9XFR3_APOLU|nr:hypothetical protein GE061_017698 [Apolygus lucorum]
MPQQDPAVNNFPLCMALYDNTAETPDELSFTAGEILVVLELESPGLDGWWVCSLEGRQGICPSNRLKMLTEAEQALKKQAWQNQTKAPVNVGVKPEVAFLYDSPVQRHCGTPQPSEQYDVPPTAQSVQVEESLRYSQPGVYDVPKGGEVTLDMTAALEWLGGLGAKLGPLVAALNKADLQIKDCVQKLEAIGWYVNQLQSKSILCLKTRTLWTNVQTAAAVTDESGP